MKTEKKDPENLDNKYSAALYNKNYVLLSRRDSESAEEILR